jgi:hypothetical protein
MIVKLKEVWMGSPVGTFLDLQEIKANDLFKRGIAEAGTYEQAKAAMEKKQKMQREFKDKMLKAEKVADKAPDKTEEEKAPEKPPEKKIELKIRQPVANK